MQLTNQHGSPSIRLNRHMSSLWIEYPRDERRHGVLALLFNRQPSGKIFKLPVLSADTRGVEIKLPLLLTGMFYLKIVDGDLSFLSQIALQ
jgi:hypothetical protein